MMQSFCKKHPHMGFCVRAVAPPCGYKEEEDWLHYKEGQAMKVLQINDLIT